MQRELQLDALALCGGERTHTGLLLQLPMMALQRRPATGLVYGQP
ncbi:hypothetical protein [Mumia zhuanghuii]|nr:hypothetical protein [Mumia zhuanghuii]